MTTLLHSIVLALGAISLAGCAGYLPSIRNPNLTSFTDPAFVDRSFARIAVVADTADLEWRHRLEQQLTDQLRRRGGDAHEGYMFFPPTRSWTPKEKVDAMLAGGADGYLTIAIDTIGTSSQWVPETTATTVTRERNVRDTVKPGPGRDTSKTEVLKEKTTTQVEGGYAVMKQWTRFRVTLVEAATGRVAWMAVNTIHGAGADGVGSFSDLIAAQLVYDGLVKRPGM